MADEETLSPEYYVHQAREHHNVAVASLPNANQRPSELKHLLTNLAIAVDYLIELEEARAKHKWIH